jgi:dTDP-glucose pyrophosphorylase
MYKDLPNLCMTANHSIRDAINRMDVNRLGIILIVSDDFKLRGTITDGDIRRAMLSNVNLDSLIDVLFQLKLGTPYASPIAARASQDEAVYLDLLQKHRILHLPIVDENDTVVGLVTRDDFFTDQALPLHAVIMAGGLGSRLMPLTQDTPKPMLHVGDRPLLEIIVGQLREAGIRRVHVTTHHKPEKISDHFGDGQDFGVEMAYISEEKPLGTAGALALMERPKQTMLVINGDILTGLDVRRILAFHREQHAELTVAVRQYDIQLPYGVIECDGPSVRRLTEKPLEKFFVNAGIYLFEPSVHALIPCDERFDMTDLIQLLLDAGRPVCSFPIREYWLDIGHHEDFEKAQEQIKEMGPRG